MYYLFRSQPVLKEKEKNLPKTGKIFLLLFFLFHVAFLGFNFWYFYYNVAPDADTKIDVDSIDTAAVETMD